VNGKWDSKERIAVPFSALKFFTLAYRPDLMDNGIKVFIKNSVKLITILLLFQNIVDGFRDATS
jgi:hypothetical protein